MKSLWHVFAAMAVLGTLFFAASAAADIGGAMKSIANAKEPVTIQADRLRYDRKTGTYFADGHVKITQKGYTLTSEKATLNERTGDAEAKGKAYLVSPDNVVFADVIKVNFNTKLGVIEQGNILVKKGGYHIRGNPLEKVGEQEYLIKDGKFTTCNAREPFWYMRAKSLDVRMDRDVFARGAVFYIKGVPVLYMPYVWLPMLKPRTSGFMIPSGGYNTKDGVRIIESYYWAPVGNFDSTLTLDYRSLMGLGVADEIRYAESKDTSLRLYGYYMSDRLVHSDRYNLSFRYQDLFTPDLSGRADINLSDKQFFRDLTDTARERTQRTLDSNVWLDNLWNWGRGYFLGQYTEGLDQTQNNDAIVQRLPEAGFNVVKKQLLNQPLYLSLDSSVTDFYKVKGVSGGRFDAFPSLAYDFNLAGINFEPKAGYRETVYNLDNNSKTTKFDPNTGNGVLVDKSDTERGLFGAGIKAQTDLYKLYLFNSGPFEGVRHTFVPTLAYNYVAGRGGKNFPDFDGVDTLDSEEVMPVGSSKEVNVVPPRRSMIAYSLTNRFVLKYRDGTTEPRVDYLTVKFSQFYDFYADTFIGTRRRNFSSLYGEVNYRSSLRLTLNNDFRYDFYQGSLRSIDTDLRYDSRDRLWHAGIGQRYSLDAEQTFMSPSRFDFFTPSTDFATDFLLNKAQEESTVNFLTLDGGVKIGSHWDLAAKIWYDLHTGNFRETDGSATYSSQCWGLTFDYFNSPTRKQYMVMLNLKGIGNVKF
ncbi:MAG: LPS-assembly protein LptD [Nitrospirota bacterium]